MTFDEPPRTPKGENFVPMINVVFLLLIFFLMTAQIAPPEPFELNPPQAAADAAVEGRTVLHLSPEGEFAFDAARADDALAAAAEAGETIQLRVDAEMDGQAFAQALQRIAAAGIGDVDVVTVPR